ncbi:hypothetical protein DUNSADRAFT_2237, partial [Dunaliella salina]
GAWASAEEEEPQPPADVEAEGNDEGPVRDPWATPEDSEVASTLSSTHPATAYMHLPPPFPDAGYTSSALGGAGGPYAAVAVAATSVMSPRSSMEATTGGVLRPPFSAPLHQRPFHQQHERQPHYPHAPQVDLNSTPPALAAALRAQQGQSHLQPHPHVPPQHPQQHHPMLGGFNPMHPLPLHMQPPQPAMPAQQQPALEDEEDKEDDLMALLTGGASEEPPQQPHQQPPNHPYPGYGAHYPNYPHQNPPFLPPHLQGQNMPIPPNDSLGGFPHPHAALHPHHSDPWGPYADAFPQQQQQQHEAGAHPYLDGLYPGTEDSTYLQ